MSDDRNFFKKTQINDSLFIQKNLELLPNSIKQLPTIKSLDLTDNSSYAIIENTQDYPIFSGSFWFQCVDNNSASGTIINNYGNLRVSLFHEDASNFTIKMRNAEDNDLLITSSAISYSSNWVHVAFVYDYTNDYQQLFIDNVSQGITNYSSVLASENETIYIGSVNDLVSSKTKIKICELYFFTSVLSLSDVNLLYTQQGDLNDFFVDCPFYFSFSELINTNEIIDRAIISPDLNLKCFGTYTLSTDTPTLVIPALPNQQSDNIIFYHDNTQKTLTSSDLNKILDGTFENAVVDLSTIENDITTIQTDITNIQSDITQLQGNTSNSLLDASGNVQIDNNLILKETQTQIGTTGTVLAEPFYSVEIGQNSSIYGSIYYNQVPLIKGFSFNLKVYQDTLDKTSGSVLFTAGRLNILYRLSNGFYFFQGGGQSVDSNAVLSPNTWYHITMNYTENNDDTFNFHVYLDGNIWIDANNITPTLAFENTMWFGNFGTQFCHSCISELVLYNRSINTNEIITLRTQQLDKTSLDTAIIYYYSFRDTNLNQTDLALTSPDEPFIFTSGSVFTLDDKPSYFSLFELNGNPIYNTNSDNLIKFYYNNFEYQIDSKILYHLRNLSVDIQAKLNILDSNQSDLLNNNAYIDELKYGIRYQHNNKVLYLGLNDETIPSNEVLTIYVFKDLYMPPNLTLNGVTINKFSYLGNVSSDVQIQFNEINNSITVMEIDINNKTSDINNNTNLINSLTTSVNTNTSNITNLTTTVNYIDTSVINNNSQISILNSKTQNIATNTEYFNITVPLQSLSTLGSKFEGDVLLNRGLYIPNLGSNSYLLVEAVTALNNVSQIITSNGNTFTAQKLDYLSTISEDVQFRLNDLLNRAINNSAENWTNSTGVLYINIINTNTSNITSIQNTINVNTSDITSIQNDINNITYGNPLYVKNEILCNTTNLRYHFFTHSLNIDMNNRNYDVRAYFRYASTFTHNGESFNDTDTWVPVNIGSISEGIHVKQDNNHLSFQVCDTHICTVYNNTWTTKEMTEGYIKIFIY